MSERFTPGPWRLKFEPAKTWRDGDTDPPGYHIDAAGQTQIAYVWGQGTRVGTQDVSYFGSCNLEADARLIAAAPAMYAALVAAKEELRLIRMIDTDVVYDPTVRGAIDAALELARGPDAAETRDR